MHPVFWAVKRAHFSIWRFAWKNLRKIRVTPARLDLIALVAMGKVSPTQKALRIALGVARATMSELLRDMERLGLVTRSRCTDRRMRSVKLTAKAERILDAVREFQLEVDWKVGDSLARDTWPSDAWRRGDELEESCAWLRKVFGDLGLRVLHAWPDTEA